MARASESLTVLPRGDAGATLPTGEDARPNGKVVSEAPAFPAIPAPFLNGYDQYRSYSLSPGHLAFSSRFGWRHDPLGQGVRFHSGVDIPARAGASVLAVRAGRVVFAGRVGGYGNLVVLDHGSGVRSHYGHLERALVTAGERVGTGSLIGLVGSTGRATGPHLHYEVRIGGSAIDPVHATMSANASAADEPLGLDTLPAREEPVAEVSSRWSLQISGQAADLAMSLPAPVIQ